MPPHSRRLPRPRGPLATAHLQRSGPRPRSSSSPIPHVAFLDDARSAPFIWMAARTPPDYARSHLARLLHRHSGKSNILTANHDPFESPAGSRCNGVPRSERATLTEHWIRHGDLSYSHQHCQRSRLSHRRPFMTNYQFCPRQGKRYINPFPCESVVEVAHPHGYVPHHLPGTNPFLADFAAKYHLPQEAARGGAEVHVSRIPAEAGESLRQRPVSSMHYLAALLAVSFLAEAAPLPPRSSLSGLWEALFTKTTPFIKKCRWPTICERTYPAAMDFKIFANHEGQQAHQSILQSLDSDADELYRSRKKPRPHRPLRSQLGRFGSHYPGASPGEGRHPGFAHHPSGQRKKIRRK